MINVKQSKGYGNTSIRLNEAKYMQALASTGLIERRPCNHEMEARLLGALMLERDVIVELIDKIHLELFDLEAHKYIFKAIKHLFTEGQGIDTFTVIEQLKKDGTLELIGGGVKVTDLTFSINSTANVETHYLILAELFIKRKVLDFSAQNMANAQDHQQDAFELLDKAQQNLFDLSELNIKKNYEKIGDSIKTTLKELQEMRKAENQTLGIPTGFTTLDRVTTGWQKSDLVIIAARPGMGKTAFILSAMRNAAVQFKKPVVIFSLEMSVSQLVKRMISSECEISSQKFRNAKFDQTEWEILFQETDTLQHSPIFIDDTPALSILELRAKCRRLKNQHQIELIIIDYLQLMTNDSAGQKPGNREQDIAYISRSLKQIAKELDVAVIALSQLNRSVETRGGSKKPQLSDLRESGSIEQDADMVMFIYRPEYYGLTENEEGESTKEVAEMIIGKKSTWKSRHCNIEIYWRLHQIFRLESK